HTRSDRDWSSDVCSSDLAVWSGKIATDDELLPTIHAILDPGAAAFSRLVQAVLSFPDDPFKPLLAHRGQQIFGCCLDVIRNLDSLVAEGNDRLQERSSLKQRKSCQITILPAQQIE